MSIDARPDSSPPEAWEPFVRLARSVGRPLERFLHIESASGILLLAAAAVALAWANSEWGDAYARLWHVPLGLRVGPFSFERSLEWFVNDVLMVLFFFVVGMEIRREIHAGELSEWRRAALPAAAAVGGMIAPAALYLWVAGAPETRSGWGVPMATDIAFAVGILALLGKRVPAALRVLLLALAIIDDLGAIAVIALFYSSGVKLAGLLVAVGGVVAVFALQGIGVRSKLAYVLPAALVWAGIYAANIHPTIAGVIIGLVTPVRTWLGREGFLHGVERELEHLRSHASERSQDELLRSLRIVAMARREAVSPADGLIGILHPWVAFGIMPLFALANAGVPLTGEPLAADAWTVATGIALGLFVGKPVGILLVSALALRLGLGALPAGLSFRHLLVLGLVAGVGFTMALFVAHLAFADAELLASAKIGVLAASLGAGIVGLVAGRVLLRPSDAPGIARSPDEAERSTEW
ncbi:MAG TPA: Na+/H+ antiporter NhaA [Myxococcota bacterium]|nr:Na+/H+ antiporter NhaA [Myxococcota bacterium]